MHGCEVHLPNGNAIVIDGCGDTAEETEAITRLIAQAPALREALENLEAITSLAAARQHAGAEVRADDWSEMLHCCNQAKAVLARIEGKEQAP